MASTIAAALRRDQDVNLNAGDLENFDRVEASHIYGMPRVA